jgi:hypothetical protein
MKDESIAGFLATTLRTLGSLVGFESPSWRCSYCLREFPGLGIQTNGQRTVSERPRRGERLPSDKGSHCPEPFCLDIVIKDIQERSLDMRAAEVGFL